LACKSSRSGATGIWRQQIDKISNARCQKWRENLSVYNFNVEWKEGKTHYVANRLSRAPYWDPPEVDTVFCFAINPTQGIHIILREAAGEEDYKWFYLLGRPGKIKCNNGPCFRTEFKNWAKDMDIIVNNSAPNKPTSNGLAERAVGIVKHMLLKHHLNYEAFMHALTEFKATPQTDSYSPSLVFYGRRMKTEAPSRPQPREPG
jgi:hypothetical protein